MEFENLLTLIRTMSDSELTELKYEENGVKIRLSRKKEVVQEVPVKTEYRVTECESSVPQKQTETKTEGRLVTSPLVGVFYVAPAEDADPFVQVGTVVKKGQTMAIVEAMKLMNEIESEFDGTVAEVLVENGTAVEYGQPLFRIV